MNTPIIDLLMNLRADMKPIHVYRQAIVSMMLF